MSKKQTVSIIVISVILAWMFSIFPGRLLVAKISTWPLLNKWQLLSPQAPIVINNRETIRVTDSGDLVSAAGQIKSRISLVVLINGSTETVAGSALNLTSDGSFVTAAGTFSQRQGNYFVVLNDGSQAAVTEQVLDPATSLVFFKANVSSVPVANLAPSKNLSVAEQLLLASGSLQNFAGKVSLTEVNSVQNDIDGQVFQSDYPRRSFAVSFNSPAESGAGLFNNKSEIEGIWNGSAVISADVLSRAMALYFNSQQTFSRPSFGFSYAIIGSNSAKLRSLPEGAEIKTVTPGLPAQKGGLLPGDIITVVEGKSVNLSSPLEELLEKYAPGDKVGLAVNRKGQPLTLNLTAVELKSSQQ